jgi:hypothetical protein
MADDGAYRAAHLEEALAEDPRVHEPELRVTVVGRTVRVAGVVPTADRRAAVAAVLSEAAAGFEVENLTTVADQRLDPSVERLT